MKVKISYTIEDSEISNEIAKFIRKASDKINNSMNGRDELYRRISASFNTNSINLYLNELQDIRRQLTEADVVLSDCHEILDGLNNLITQQQMQQQNAKQQSEQEKSAMPDLEFEGGDE